MFALIGVVIVVVVASLLGLFVAGQAVQFCKVMTVEEQRQFEEGLRIGLGDRGAIFMEPRNQFKSHRTLGE